MCQSVTSVARGGLQLFVKQSNIFGGMQAGSAATGSWMIDQWDL
jgi:hypothetical protein